MPGEKKVAFWRIIRYILGVIVKQKGNEAMRQENEGGGVSSGSKGLTVTERYEERMMRQDLNPFRKLRLNALAIRGTEVRSVIV